MAVNKNAHVELSKMQKDIEKFLDLKHTELLYDFKETKNHAQLNLITVNLNHNESFLFNTVEGVDKVDAVRKMLDYVKKKRPQENTFTIQWIREIDKEIQTSYFRAKNMYEALDKFYFGRDINSTQIFSIVLNPVS